MDAFNLIGSVIGSIIAILGVILSHVRLGKQLNQTQEAVRALEKIASTYEKEIELLQQITQEKLNVEGQKELRKERELQWKILTGLAKAGRWLSEQ